MAKKKKAIGWLAEVVGGRGENIFELAITDYSETNAPLFRAAFLGEKWPALDYLVELVGVQNATPHFFVQVKSTITAIQDDLLRVTLDAKKARLLARVPGPTYIVGVHEPSKRVFIRAVNDAVQGVYEISVNNELTPPNLKVLYDEVKTFWNARDRKPDHSAFQ